MAAKPMNKFTKSVLEREQKELPKAVVLMPEEKQIPAPNPQANHVESVEPSIPTKKSQKVAGTIKLPKKAPSAPSQESHFSLESFIIPGQGRHAKNKTFYLDAAVIEAIKNAANDNRIAESKLVNDILKKVLNV